MDHVTFAKEALCEHQFWLMVMRNHGKFIYDALSACQKRKISMAIHFIKVFEEMLEQSRKNLNLEQIYELTKMAFAYAEEFRNFKLQLISEYDNTQIDLPGSCLHHMLNETLEYLQFINQTLETLSDLSALSEKSENLIDEVGSIIL